ncbi:DUF202 domain-containing protein [Candidatus Roizmanbacteria bacterium]|nr:DUF202 domain-containing protein [Candidatus Roizmanbacteria bacterium]
MIANTYHNLDKDVLILRDQLAIDRTLLAVERTFLSYLRTSLTFFIAGASFIKFFNEPFIVGLGWIFLPSGILFFFLGLQRYIATSRLVFNSKQKEFNVKDVNSSIFQLYLFFAEIFHGVLVRFNKLRRS